MAVIEIQVKGQTWRVESVVEDGEKLHVNLEGGQVIVVRGATADIVRKGLDAATPSQKAGWRANRRK